LLNDTASFDFLRLRIGAKRRPDFLAVPLGEAKRGLFLTLCFSRFFGEHSFLLKTGGEKAMPDNDHQARSTRFSKDGTTVFVRLRVDRRGYEYARHWGAVSPCGHA
jgi:hypothetical protein